MTGHDDLFEGMLDELEIELPALGRKELDRLCALTLSRAGLAGGRPRRKRRWVRVLAAAAVAATLLAACYYFTVSDAFRGVLTEQADTEPSETVVETEKAVTVPLQKNVSLVNKAGVAPMRTVSAGGLNVTLRGAVIDELGYKILVEAKSADGSPLRGKGENVAEYLSLAFLETTFTVEGGEYPPWTVTPLDDDPTDGSASFLMEGDGLPPTARGKTAKLVLKNLTQSAVFRLPAVSAPTAPAQTGEVSLYELYAKLSPFDPEEFEISEAGGRHGGEKSVEYDRVKPAKTSIKFSRKYPNAVLDAMLVKDGNLYLFGTTPDDLRKGAPLEGMTLKDLRTGEVLKISGGGGGGSLGSIREPYENKLHTWERYFKGIESVEDLKNYTVARPTTGDGILSLDGKADGGQPLVNGGAEVLPVSMGEWAFEFPLDYKASERTAAVSLPVRLAQRDYILRRVTLSPFCMGLDLVTADGGGAPLAELARAKTGYDAAVLNKADGSALSVKTSGGSADGDSVHLRYAFNHVVIDPKEIASVTIGGVTVPL